MTNTHIWLCSILLCIIILIIYNKTKNHNETQESFDVGLDGLASSRTALASLIATPTPTVASTLTPAPTQYAPIVKMSSLQVPPDVQSKMNDQYMSLIDNIALIKQNEVVISKLASQLENINKKLNLYSQLVVAPTVAPAST